MSWHWALVALLAGFAGGYIACDRMTVESKITYIIKKLRARDGGAISVDAEATVVAPDRKAARIERRLKRKKDESK